MIQEKKVTYFHDWFDQNFKLPGSVNNIRGVIENNQPLLVFEMVNDNGVESGEERFLFSGSSLILQEK